MKKDLKVHRRNLGSHQSMCGKDIWSDSPSLLSGGLEIFWWCQQIYVTVLRFWGINAVLFSNIHQRVHLAYVISSCKSADIVPSHLRPVQDPELWLNYKEGSCKDWLDKESGCLRGLRKRVKFYFISFLCHAESWLYLGAKEPTAATSFLTSSPDLGNLFST